MAKTGNTAFYKAADGLPSELVVIRDQFYYQNKHGTTEKGYWRTRYETTLNKSIFANDLFPGWFRI